MALIARAFGWQLALGATVWLLGPSPTEIRALLTAPQAYVDQHGPDAAAIVIAESALSALALLVAIAIALTAVGEVTRAPGRLRMPGAWARRLAGVLLGLSVLPATSCAQPQQQATSISVESEQAGPTVIDQFDWPTSGQSQDSPATELPPDPAPPDPAASSQQAEPEPASADQTSTHTVAAGECLWTIAATHLGSGASLADIAEAADMIWAANAQVIGADPDLLHPGQVLDLTGAGIPAS